MTASNRPHREKSRLLDGYVSRYSDAAVRRRANIALRAARVEAELAYRSRGDFLANMNHELRTPLNAIIGFANMLKEEGRFQVSDELRAEYLEYITQSADLLLGHINTILDLAAAESGGTKVTRRAVAPVDLFSAATDNFRPMAEAAGVMLEFSADPDLPEIDIDPDRIQTAFGHLVENAITYCNEGSTISVMLRHGRRKNERRWVYIAIRDDGTGMSNEELARALHSFEQVHQGLDRKFEGTGIGLPIAKSFIELNGGRFDIKSRKGKGTTVRFALPGSLQAGASGDEAESGADFDEMLREAG